MSSTLRDEIRATVSPDKFGNSRGATKVLRDLYARYRVSTP